ncbi:hypothetical protein [Cylindrospermopsis curvispora]|uniref:hypothetical protein n=1 Tax=Cylindrospermopsis curvispora TaxID=747548 RepID=UPI0038B2D8C9
MRSHSWLPKTYYIWLYLSYNKCTEDAISITFSPDGKLLATGARDKTITVFPWNPPRP